MTDIDTFTGTRGVCWIETFTGKAFHILDPKPEEICIEDIAHALSQQCRFTGHTKRFYSVAEHCYQVSLITDSLEGHLHDADETYISDMSRPLKHFSAVGKEYIPVEAKIQRVIFAKYGLAWPISPEVKFADMIMLLVEKEQLMTNLEWERDWVEEVDGYDRSRIRLMCWKPEVAEHIFLSRFYELTTHAPSAASTHPAR